MKKAVFIAISLVWAFRADAQGIGDSLVVNLKNGQRITIPLEAIHKIMFDSLTASVVAGPKNSELQLSNFPNPSSSGTNIQFSVPTSGRASIQIYDQKGNLVRTLVSNCGAGENVVPWDGLNENSSPVPTGAYFYEVHFGSEVQTKRMVVIQ